MGIFNKNEGQEEGQVPAQIPDPEPEQEIKQEAEELTLEQQQKIRMERNAKK